MTPSAGEDEPAGARSVSRLAQWVPTWLGPPVVVAACLIAYLGWVLVREGGDPLAFARVGDGFRDGRPVGEEGYDGQFAYYIALDPRPWVVAAALDVPAYRYQRILYPLLARLLALGQAAFIPWTLVAINFVAHVTGTSLVEQWLLARGASRWYALTYGLWAGLVMAVRLDLNEPLAYALVAAALLADGRGRAWLSAACFGLSVFAKETALLFLAAQVLAVAFSKRTRDLRPLILAALPFIAFQFLLRAWFGAFGLASGGYLATPFEPIPFAGLLRIGAVSPPALALFVVIFGPLVVFPSLWGLVAAIQRILTGDRAPATLALAVNAGMIPFTPFSTFREPLGLIRLATGLVLATVIFGAHLKSRRVLNYSLLWLAALAFLRE